MARSFSTGSGGSSRTNAPSSQPAGHPGRHARLIPDLRPGERVISLQRHHPAVLAGRLAAPLVILALWLVSLIFVLPFIAALQQPDPLGPPPEGLQAWLPTALWLGWLFVAAFLVLWAAYRVLDWSDDWIALTSRRLIVMDKALFLRETRREVPIDRVQNVTADYPNSMGVAFDFGNLRVDTAGIGVVEFKDLPHPRQMREGIFTQQAELQAARPSPEDSRKAAVRSIMRGTDPALHELPTPPDGITLPADLSKGTGPSMLGALFPFAPQREDDGVTWHKHWFFLLRGLAGPTLLWLIVAVAWFAVMLFGGEGQFGSAAVILGWAAVGLAPVCLLWALWKWDDWRNDIYRLAGDRIYDIDRLPLGMREQSKETLITRVTDVTYLVPGPLAHLLNYGDVELKTPGEATQFVFEHVPRPREIQAEIMDRIEEYRVKARSSNDREIEAWIKAYNEVQREGA